MRIKATCAFFIALAWLAVTGCSRSVPLPPFESRPHGMYPGGDDSLYVAYRLGIGDELEIEVARHKEFEGKAVVEASGFITLPTSLDRIKVIGLTVGEVESKIADTLEPYLISKPRVNVRLSNPNSRFVYVIGAVHQPGKLVVKDERLFVREAIYRAGQPTETAALKRVMLVSSGPDHAESRKINLKRILYKGELQENYEMKPGDIIYVPNLYITDFSWWLTQILRPFQIVVNGNQTASDIGNIPSGGK